MTYHSFNLLPLSFNFCQSCHLAILFLYYCSKFEWCNFEFWFALSIVTAGPFSVPDFFSCRVLFNYLIERFRVWRCYLGTTRIVRYFSENKRTAWLYRRHVSTIAEFFIEKAASILGYHIVRRHTIPESKLRQSLRDHQSSVRLLYDMSPSDISWTLLSTCHLLTSAEHCYN